jgi:hypothetical protein
VQQHRSIARRHWIFVNLHLRTNLTYNTYSFVAGDTWIAGKRSKRTAAIKDISVTDASRRKRHANLLREKGG